MLVLNLRSLLPRKLFKPSNFRPIFKRFVAGSDIDIEIDEKDEREYQEIVAHYFTHNIQNSCYIIHPWVKWGPNKVRDFSPQYQLEEAASLIRTLHPWRVSDSTSISLDNLDRKTIFSSGNLEKLKRRIRGDPQITSVFINMGSVKTSQREELERTFQVPIFDRLNIIMLILKRHAISKNAILQVALAEVLYLQTRQKRIDSSGIAYEIRKLMLQKREKKIKTAIKKLRNQRKRMREKRKEMNYPIVAIVGYTNSGKTSLIKALTGDVKLQPKDQLFATLDVTLHAGLLPSKMEVLFLDTVGFISNIPETLVECFLVTLEDALFSDVIVHVEDISSSYLLHQRGVVTKTLTDLSNAVGTADIMDKVITVENKCDLLQHQNMDHTDDILYVSAKTGFGLDELRKKIENAVVENTDRCTVSLRVPVGGDEIRWLYKNAVIIGSEFNDETEFQDVKVIIPSGRLEQFKHYFIKEQKK